jgi:hypothetical protein
MIFVEGGWIALKHMAITIQIAFGCQLSQPNSLAGIDRHPNGALIGNDHIVQARLIFCQTPIFESHDTTHPIDRMNHRVTGFERHTLLLSKSARSANNENTANP